MSWASVLMASPVATLGSQFCFFMATLKSVATCAELVSVSHTALPYSLITGVSVNRYGRCKSLPAIVTTNKSFVYLFYGIYSIIQS